MFTPSSFQKAIFNFISSGNGNGIIKAVAGSGKTTTLVESLKLTYGKVLFLAFNKAIAETLKKRSPSHVDCSTLHSAGFSLLRSIGKKIKVDNYKIDNIMNQYIPLQVTPSIKGKEAVDLFTDRKVVKTLVSLVKANLTDYTNVENLADLAGYYGIDDYQPKHNEMVKYVIETNNRMHHVIDFDDMIYLPVILKLVSKVKYDFIFVDECQDLNRSQIELVLSLTSATGRVISVGDPNQSIYGFRGADVGAMERMKIALNAQEFPLSVCYRCPSSIIKLAQDIVPEITGTDTASEGSIVNIKENAFLETLTKENDHETLTICRTNAELVGHALKLIANGHKAIIKGRDIGQNLISLVNKMKAADIGNLELNLTEWKNKELDKLSKRFNPDSAIALVNDKYDALMLIIHDCDTVDCVILKLDKLFNDDSVNGYIFSSVHKAKGLEAKNVYILAPDKLPLQWRNQKSWEFEQEMNIKYVAVTRSLDKLVFVNKD